MMRKALISFISILLLIPSVFADDLSEYPNMFISGDNVNVVTIVGDKASATHVLAQTKIALTLSDEAGKPTPGLNRLASEIGDIEDINVISIGNACDNPITAEILGNPKPCESGLEKDTATLQLFESESGRHHLILNAYGDEGIKMLGEVLSNYEDYDLEGDSFEIEVEDEPDREFIEQKSERVVPRSEEDEEADENEDDTGSEDEERSQETSQSSSEERESDEDRQDDNFDDQTDSQENQAEPEPILKEEDNLILKLVNWFKGLFR